MGDTDLLVALVCGAVLTLILEVFAVLMWIYSKPPEHVPRGQFSPFVPARSPPAVAIGYRRHYQQQREAQRDPQDRSSPSPSSSSQSSKETCDWLNYVIDFLFQELRDSPEVHRLVTKQLNKEFQELMLTKLEGRMIEQLAVREFTMGQSLPVFSDIEVVKLERDSDDEECGRSQLVELQLNVDYSGGFQVAIDADLVFQKSAYVSINVKRVCGRGRVQLSRKPYTHWSFAFLEFPLLELNVDSRFEGRNLPHLSNVIENQFKRWVRKKHTLPNYKVRYKPIFKKIQPQSHLLDVYVHDQRLTEGTLKVRVEECSRLQIVDLAVELYCTLEIASSPRVSQFGVWRTAWPLFDVSIARSSLQGNKIGIAYKMLEEDSSFNVSQHVVLINRVDEDSPAQRQGIKEGDILYKIDNVRVTGTKHAERLIKKSSGKRILLVVQRPPTHLNLHKHTNSTSAINSTFTAKDHKRSPKAGDKKRSHTFSHSSPPIHQDRPTTSDPDESYAILDTSEATNSYDHSLTDEEPPSGPRRRGLSMGRGADDTVSLMGVAGELRSRSPSAVAHTSVDDSVVSQQARDRITLHRSHSQVTSTSTHPSTSNSNSSSFQNTHPHTHDRKQGKTKSVAVTRNPRWAENFVFPIQSEDNYCSVCVWSKLQRDLAQEGDLLIGYATISLTDIALLCATNTSGQYHQRYTLTPSHTKLANKAALKISSNPQLPPTASNAFATQKLKYAGDILLQFIHTPTCEKKSMKTRRRREREMARERRGSGRESSMDGSGEVKEDIDRGPQQDSDSTMATRIRASRPPKSPTQKHNFTPVDHGTAKTVGCSVCHKKETRFDRVTRNKLLCCSVCGIITHGGKCKRNCKPCTRERGLEETPPEPFEDLSLLPVKEADSSDEEESRTTPISHSSHPPHAFPVELPPCKPPLSELSHIRSREESPEKPDTQLPSQSTTLHEGKEGRSEGMADSPKMKYVEARTLVLPNTPLKDNMQMQGGGGQTLRDHMEFLDDDIDGVHSADENYTPPMSDDEEEDQHRGMLLSYNKEEKQERKEVEEDEEEQDDEDREESAPYAGLGGTESSISSQEMETKVAEARITINRLTADKEAILVALSDPKITSSGKKDLTERLEKIDQQLESTQLWVMLFQAK